MNRTTPTKAIIIAFSLCCFSFAGRVDAQEEYVPQVRQNGASSYEETVNYILDSYLTSLNLTTNALKEVTGIKDCVLYYKVTDAKGVETNDRGSFKNAISVDADDDPQNNGYKMTVTFNNGKGGKIAKQYYYFTDVTFCRDIYDAFQRMRQFCAAPGEPYN